MAFCRLRGIARAATLILALAVGAFASPNEVTAQTPTFASGVDSVRLDALVSDNGRPITGLNAAGFEILDNSTQQSIDYVGLDQLPVNVVSVLDMSVSVSGGILEQLQAAMKAVANGLRIGDQVALLTFNHRVILGLPLPLDANQLPSALLAIRPSGGTALIDAAYSALWVAEPDPGPTIIVVSSDGLDTASWLARDRVLMATKRTWTRRSENDPLTAQKVIHLEA